MQIEQKFNLPVPREKAWALMLDVPRIAPCMPGVEKFEQIDEKSFAGTMKVKVGPISLSFEATATLEERDDANFKSKMGIQGTDRKVGGAVRGAMYMSLSELSPNETQVTALTDVNVLGKIGQFGFSVMKKKADEMLNQFVACVKTKI